MVKPIGIDLGTTYSAIAYVDEHGEAKIINDAVDTSQRIIPSVVLFNTVNDIIVGQDAKDEIDFSPEKVVAFVKREMGKNKDEVCKDENTNEPTPYDFYGKRYSPEDISAFILKKLKENAENYFNEPVNDVVITVPAYFNEFERKATINAGRKAGFNVLQVINEPTAASIAYSITRVGKEKQKAFVFDLGGGTFDVTILNVNNSEINVIATDGDHKLGGKDWDDRIIKFVVDKFIDKYSEDPRNDSEVMGALRIKAENAKKKLSQQDAQLITVNYKGNKLKVEVTRDKFEELTADLMENVKDLCEIVLNDSNLSWRDIDTILLVGGSTRMPMVQNLLKEISGKEIRTDLIQPDECVALGAALKCKMIFDKNNGLSKVSYGGLIKINDVASHSLGFVTLKDGKLYNSIMIKKNSKIPCKVVNGNFKTSFDNQTTLEVLVLQGESNNPHNCTLLYGYKFLGLPKRRKGEVRLEVTFEYNENNVVDVTAKTNSTKLKSDKITNPTLPKLEKVVQIPIFVIIAIDLSGSMYGALDDAKEAALEFIEKMDFTNTKVALITFNDRAIIDQTFTNVPDVLRAKIRNWDCDGGTSAEPFEEALEVMGNVEGKKIIITLTDGEWFEKDRALRNAKRCNDNNIEINAIGFGDADIYFLKQISTTVDGYKLLSSTTELTKTMLNIATEITQNYTKTIS